MPYLRVYDTLRNSDVATDHLIHQEHLTPVITTEIENVSLAIFTASFDVFLYCTSHRELLHCNIQFGVDSYSITPFGLENTLSVFR